MARTATIPTPYIVSLDLVVELSVGEEVKVIELPTEKVEL